MTPRFFETPAEFRRWLEENHEKEPELLVGFNKVGSGRPTITWPQSVDEALCFGWIDGIRRRVDDESYTIRFTPRRKRSIWSTVNLRRIEELIAESRVHPAGLKVFQERDPEKTGQYSFERQAIEFDPTLAERLRANEAAWAFYQSQPPWYRKTTRHWVMSAKKEVTRARRMERLIEDSAQKRLISALSRPSTK